MEVSFSKTNDSAAVPVTEHIPVQTPVGDTATHLPAVRKDTRPTLSEVILPRLNLVHSVGQLKDSFNPGAYVYGQQFVLYTPPLINAKTSTIERAGTPPLIVTFLDCRPVRFFENVKGGARGLICNTEEQVRAAGGTTNYQEFKLKEASGMRRFDYAVDCLLAIERPECCVDDDTTFVFPVDGKKYALALYNMKASAFTVLKKTVNTARLIGCLRDGLETYSWALSSRLEPTPDRTSTYWKPVLIPSAKSTPAFIEFASSVLQAPKIEAAPEDDAF